VIPNIWAITQDVEEADRYLPERWLGTELNEIHPEHGKPQLPDPLEYVFGFGRRSCPGSHLALSILYDLFTSFLLRYSISKPSNFSFPTFRHGVIVFPQKYLSKVEPRVQDEMSC